MQIIALVRVGIVDTEVCHTMGFLSIENVLVGYSMNIEKLSQKKQIQTGRVSVLYCDLGTLHTVCAP